MPKISRFGMITVLIPFMSVMVVYIQEIHNWTNFRRNIEEFINFLC
ncbi:hypothetical protein FM107_17825 [Sphingobacterium sp. JB170]|nr:hypothetical protein FM107_17825 [Sphingobacterium sp. JB170]